MISCRKVGSHVEEALATLEAASAVEWHSEAATAGEAVSRRKTTATERAETIFLSTMILLL